MIERKVILIVEDESDDLALITRSLGEDNPALSWVAAHNGLEALEYLDKVSVNNRNKHKPLPALILMDLSMPKMGGIALLPEIRKRENTRYIPVVVFTSSKNVQDVTSCYEAGASSYIRKPTDFASFRTAVQHLSKYWVLLNTTPY